MLAWRTHRSFWLTLGVIVLAIVVLLAIFGEDLGLWGTATDNAPATGGNEWLTLPLEGGNEWLTVPIQGGNEWLAVPLEGGNTWAEADLIQSYVLSAPDSKVLLDVTRITAFNDQIGIISFQVKADTGLSNAMQWFQTMQTNPTIQSYVLAGLDSKGGLVAGWKIRDASLTSLQPLENPDENTVAYEVTFQFTQIAMR